MLDLESATEISVADVADERLRTRVGVLGDKPGAGKSFVVLALAVAGDTAPASRDFSEYHVSLYTSVVRRESRTQLPLSVVVIPHGLARQWDGYLEEYLPEGLRGLLLGRRKQFDELTPERLVGGYFRVVVVTTTMLPQLAQLLNGEMNGRVSRVFYDECDTADVRQSSVLRAGFHWFVSASFHNLLLPYGGVAVAPGGEELPVYGCYAPFLRGFFTALQGVDERLVKRMLVYSDSDFVDASLQIPEPVVFTVPCRTPFVVRVLAGSVRASIVRALNAGDVAAAVRNMGATLDTEGNVIAAVLDRYKRERRVLEGRLGYVDDLVNLTRAQREAERARCEARIGVLDRCVASISERVRESVTCPICFEDMRCKTVVPCCSNSFCLACITEWANGGPRAYRSTTAACPMCKAPLALQACMVCSDGSGATAEPDAPGPASEVELGGVRFEKDGEKLDNLVRLLGSAGPERRFLVFSEYDYILEESIAAALQAAGVAYGMIKHNANTINRVVADFRAGAVRVLLVNSRHYGSGMNLPEATDIAIMHRLTNGRSYHQIVGRAQRFRREGALRVWWFLNDNEAQRGTGPALENDLE